MSFFKYKVEISISFIFSWNHPPPSQMKKFEGDFQRDIFSMCTNLA